MADGPGARPGPVEDLVRFLRQRYELGGDPLILESLDRTEVGRLIRDGLARPTFGEPSPERSGTEMSRNSERTPGPSAPPAHATPTATARPESATIVPDDLPESHEALRDLVLGCTRCGLAEDRTQVVFNDGNPEARLMVVGEAPGANEDRTGVPFVGAAGQFLDLILATVGLSREDSVYICNVIKCRPPGNRNPKSDEIAACAPYLKRQIQVVKPRAILAVGTFSAQLLTGKDIALGRIRGEVYSWEGTPLVVTYHPAALLRNSGWIRPTWEDLQLLRTVLDGPDA